MTSLVFSVIAATSLVTAAVGAPGETRSAQSLPNDNLAASAAHSPATGKFQKVNRLADGSYNGDWDHTDKVQCDFHHWHWYTKEKRCRRTPAALWFIGAATAAGLGYALASRDDSHSNQAPMSH